MAKKETLESFNHKYQLKDYIESVNYTVNGVTEKDKNHVRKIIETGLEFHKNLAEIHAKREKPGFFSRLFNTKYNQLWKKEHQALNTVVLDLYTRGVKEIRMNPAANYKFTGNFFFESQWPNIRASIQHPEYGNSSRIWTEGVSYYVEAKHEIPANPIPADELDKKPAVKQAVDFGNDIEVKESTEEKDFIKDFEVTEKKDFPPVTNSK